MLVIENLQWCLSKIWRCLLLGGHRGGLLPRCFGTLPCCAGAWILPCCAGAWILPCCAGVSVLCSLCSSAQGARRGRITSSPSATLSWVSALVFARCFTLHQAGWVHCKKKYVNFTECFGNSVTRIFLRTRSSILFNLQIPVF